MTENILLENLDRPEVLEEVYRRSPQEFKEQFKVAFEKNGDSETLRVWDARLSYTPSTSTKKLSIGWLIAVCLIAGAIVKLPSFSSIDGDWFYPRFVPIVIIGTLIFYFLKTAKARSSVSKVVFVGVALSALYLAVLPNDRDSASVTMALVHLPMLMMSFLGASFMGEGWNSVESRLNFIRYLGEMAIYSALILLGGMGLTAITLGMFSYIGFFINEWYANYVVVLGLVSAPLVATYLFDSIQNRQSKFASILSNVFAPLFLVTVLAYLVASAFQGKSPFIDRDFLVTFNGLLIVILALTIFSISGKNRANGVTAFDYINVSLIGATLIVNVIALSAILFRWAEFGFTVNRVVVSGVNILIFVHLILLLRQYIAHLKSGDGQYKLETTIARYLPVYSLWSFIVSIFLPVVFLYG